MIKIDETFSAKQYLNGWELHEKRMGKTKQGIPKETVNITYHPSFRLLAAKLIDRKIGCAESLEQVNATIVSAVGCFAELAEAITAE